MLTYRTGAAGSPGAARAMAAHLLEQTLSSAQMALAQYYEHGTMPAALRPDPGEAQLGAMRESVSSPRGPGGDVAVLDAAIRAEPGLGSGGIAFARRIAAMPETALADLAQTMARVRSDMHPGLVRLLALDPTGHSAADEIAAILGGRRADGWPIDGKQVQRPVVALADLLGLDPSGVPQPEQIAHILEGKRADGTALRGDADAVRQRFLRLYGVRDREPNDAALAMIRSGRLANGHEVVPGSLQSGLTASRAAIGYIDLCWSADKTVSLAWALAPTPVEQNMILQAHREAVESAMRVVERGIGQARRGKGGCYGAEKGAIGWIAFEHFASRPTVEVVRRDEAGGASHTELVTLKVAGDPQLHTHVAVPNVVLTPSGRVGSLDLQQLEGRVHEWGALYQAYLAANLRRAGIATSLDPQRGSARITMIPEALRQAFSKRTERGVDAARRYARDAGLDWDALSPEQQIGFAKRGVQGDPRQAKQDDLSDRQAWWKQARALGWRARSVITQPGEASGALHQVPAPVRFPTPIAVSGAGMTEAFERRCKEAGEANYSLRILVAYHEALPFLERDLKRRAVIDESVARVAAARGLIVSGIADETDVDAVMTMFFKYGVRQDGEMVRLLRGETDTGPRSRVRLTTAMHAAREAELINLARRAARNRRDVLPEMDLAIDIAQAFGKYAPTGQGRAQADLALHLGTSGRFAVGIGVAGSGKSTVLAPLVTAWKAQRRRVYGAALAWRQSDDLEAAGIASEDRAALSVLLDRIRAGQIMLDRDSVIVIDELGLIGTRQMLELLRVRAESDCTLVAIGDPLQCQSIEAGPVIELLRKALGPQAVPELLSSVRQVTVSERETALLFRSGYADLALGRLRAEDRAMMVPGGYQQAVEAVADLWQRQRARHANEADYTLSVTAPRNTDARAIATAIRERRRAAGEIGADAVVVPACDQMDDQYDLRLAIGDRVRLFARTTARFADGGHGVIGNNGSVLEVTGVDAAGLRLRRGTGREGMVAWDRLRDPVHGRVRLTYGDVLTIDAAQGSTGTEHILAMPGGSGTVNGFKAYVSASRHRVASFMVTSEGAERGAVMARRPLGDPRPIGLSDLWAHMAENLSRQVVPESATSFLERACRVQTGAVRALHAGFQPIEQREAERQDPTTLVQTWRRNRRTHLFQDLTDAHRVVSDIRGALQEIGRVIRCLSKDVIAAATPLIDQAVWRFRRRPSQISKTADLESLRQRWVDRQMKLWLDDDLAAHPAPYWASPEFDRARIAREKREAEAKARFTREVKLMSRKALRDFASDLDLIEQMEAQMEEMRQESQRYRPGPRMGM